MFWIFSGKYFILLKKRKERKLCFQFKILGYTTSLLEMHFLSINHSSLIGEHVIFVLEVILYLRIISDKEA
jgi:hypothetical protein